MGSAFIYILASKRNGTLYVGVTSDLRRRAYEHRHALRAGFSDRYRVHRLVYYEMHADIREAIIREKRIKKWNRLWKVRLIESVNPDWRDLYPEIA
ncbi:MAG: GIY-YIG nuclease family protein [bacterium]